jgi:arylformamidase
MRILDISQPLGPATAVWPGDRPVELSWSMRMDAGDSVNVAAITTSVHAGTHADGFLHFLEGGAGADAMPLDAYLGRCRVLDVRGRQSLDVTLADDVVADGIRRVLFRTRDDADAGAFPDRIAHIEPALAQRLADAGTSLVGTDAPSVDPLDSKTLQTHHVLGRGGVAILENLVLGHVPPGDYTLVALPLRLAGADSSPVRAVLLDGTLA